jgi:hypothetical protein
MARAANPTSSTKEIATTKAAAPFSLSFDVRW